MLEPITTTDIPLRGKVDRTHVANLCNEGISHSEIARMLGVSRERVRQIDLVVNNRTAKSRMIERDKPRPRNSWPDSWFSVAARNRGLAVRIVNKYTVSVNGWSCVLGKRYGGRGPHGEYHTLCIPEKAAQFYAFPIGDGCLIVPSSMMPRLSTTVSLAPVTKFGTLSSIHGWDKCINAWHLLEELNGNR